MNGIGLFDSGVGGLALLRECVRRDPQGRWLYWGDCKNAPYGNKDAAQIMRLADNAANALVRRKVRALLLACNTVTAECAQELRARLPIPVFGIEPALRPACAGGGTVLLLATRATLHSTRVRALIAASASARIVEHCPAGLAGDIEAHAPLVDAVDLSRHLPRGRFTAVVLGCTHYALVGERIAAFYGCPVYDGIAGTVDHLFTKMNICSKNSPKTVPKSPVFLGSGKKLCKMTYFYLEKSKQMFING